MSAPTIQSIALAFPPYRLGADEATARLSEVFVARGEDPALVAQLVENSGIDGRALARPPAFYLTHTDLASRNGAYVEVARELGEQAARAALAEAGVAPEEIDLVIDTSCTGVMIPALDAHLTNVLGLRRDVRRLPLTEAGCAAGATSLAFASDYLAARPQGVALLVSVELPSLTLQLEDTRRANLVSAAIFGDGAAAVVLARRAPPRPSFEVLAHRATLFPNTEEIMGFDLGNTGFQIILSRQIPLLVRRHLREEVDSFLEAQGLALSSVDFFVLHPGGTKVLDNVRDVLELEEEDVAAARASLREHGNLSSASIHAVARRQLERGAIQPGRFGLLVAMGPGFTVELALLRGVA
ncbi:MAG: type III polyketide synthase [Planctomycetota bacterium]